jgi:hypothetical protein
MHTKHDDAHHSDSSAAEPEQTAVTPVINVPQQQQNATTPNKHKGSNCKRLRCSTPLLPAPKAATAAASKEKPSSQPSPEPHALLALATKVVGDYNMLQDLMAIAIRTMLSPLALQGLRMISYNGTQSPATALLALILQFMDNNEAANKPSLHQALG